MTLTHTLAFWERSLRTVTGRLTTLLTTTSGLPETTATAPPSCSRRWASAASWVRHASCSSAHPADAAATAPISTGCSSSAGSSTSVPARRTASTALWAVISPSAGRTADTSAAAGVASSPTVTGSPAVAPSEERRSVSGSLRTQGAELS
ncbi:hypothetical protein F1641_16780 [Quadrisphaera sp. INWT6]|nr:hypothetical protein [Quadrisphaera sp. INWT6]MBF5083284.1 hypothetical protein [Quadrisphaera sp. INWT6]